MTNILAAGQVSGQVEAKVVGQVTPQVTPQVTLQVTPPVGVQPESRSEWVIKWGRTFLSANKTLGGLENPPFGHRN